MVLAEYHHKTTFRFPVGIKATVSSPSDRGFLQDFSLTPGLVI